MAFADGDLVNRQYAQPLEIGFSVIALQVLLVDGFDGFPVQLQMLADFRYGHHLAQRVNLAG